MVLVALLCLLAINNPTIQLKKSITSYMLLVDVSQSMNAEDLLVQESPITRIEYTKLLLYYWASRKVQELRWVDGYDQQAWMEDGLERKFSDHIWYKVGC